jgi:SWI/SNF-related matrix-associated actin-dependent regulator of chromatin subfamily A member 5
MFFLDIGKRDRRTVNSYAENQARQSTADVDGEKKAAKVPKHIKLPKMDDWQFFDRKRLQDLYAMEIKLFEELVEKGETPNTAKSVFCFLFLLSI